MVAARQRLKKISIALQMYRQECGFKPIGLRTNAADAGLPQGLELIDSELKNKPWHLKESDFQVANPVSVFKNAACHYLFLWPMPEHMINGLDKYYASKGEELPVIADINMNSDVQIGKPRTVHALILRLNGKIDECDVPWTNTFPLEFIEQ